MGLINLSGHSLVEHCWPAGDMHIKYSQEYAAVTKYSRTPPLQTRAFPIYLKPSASPPPLKNDDCNDKLRAEFGAFQLTSVFGHGGGGAGGPSSWRSGGLTNSLSPGPCHLSPLDPATSLPWTPMMALTGSGRRRSLQTVSVINPVVTRKLVRD